MRSWWARIRWADVVAGAVVLTLYAGECVLLDRQFPATPAGCVETSPFSCWDLRAPIIALLSAPVWYAGWALALRPCPWPLRWLTPVAVTFTALRCTELLSRNAAGVTQVCVFVVAYLVAATVLSVLCAEAAEPRRRGSREQ